MSLLFLCIEAYSGRSIATVEVAIVKNQSIFIGSIGLFLSSFIAFPVLAAPVDCTVGVCVVSDGNASIETTASSEKDLSDVFLNGIEHLDEDEYHICSGLANSGDCEFSSVSSATMDEVTNTIVVNFSESGYDARITWTLNGSIINRAIVDKQLLLTSTTTGGPISLTVTDYTGWDLNNDGDNDTARFSAPGTLRQTQGAITADSIAVSPAQFYAVHNCVTAAPNCEEVLDDQLIAGNLNNNGGPAGPYAEYAWQDNVTLAPLASMTINRRLVVTERMDAEIPTLSKWGLILVALVLLALGAFYLRRAR